MSFLSYNNYLKSNTPFSNCFVSNLTSPLIMLSPQMLGIKYNSITLPTYRLNFTTRCLEIFLLDNISNLKHPLGQVVELHTNTHKIIKQP